MLVNPLSVDQTVTRCSFRSRVGAELQLPSCSSQERMGLAEPPLRSTFLSGRLLAQRDSCVTRAGACRNPIRGQDEVF